MFEFTENQKLWIAALQSNKYKQTTEAMEKTPLGGYYCCLGVACVLAKEAGIPIVVDANDCIVGQILTNQPEVQKWLGLADPAGEPIAALKDLSDIELESLVEMNDKGISFEEIAEHLLRYPEYYFK